MHLPFIIVDEWAEMLYNKYITEYMLFSIRR